MKKYIDKLIAELKTKHPGKKITIINGYIGILEGETLSDFTYIGSCYYEMEGEIFVDYHSKQGTQFVTSINEAQTAAI